MAFVKCKIERKIPVRALIDTIRKNPIDNFGLDRTLYYTKFYRS